jgi:Glycosyl hydrolase family 45.
MTTNIGGDVQQGQFDVMIPGGGVGLFNGCSSMGWGKQGEQYGGLLSECEKEAGTAGNLLTKRKECLAKKCESSFANDAKAKEGCMFLATWMEAAGNPTHNYREVECPPELKAQY